MAEQEGRWVTVNGAHVFIKDGESENPFASMKKTVDKKRRKQLIKEYGSNQKPLQKYNAHPMGNNFDDNFAKLKDQVKMAKRQQNGKLAQSMFSKATQMYESLKESDLTAEQRKKLSEYMEKHTYR